MAAELPSIRIKISLIRNFLLKKAGEVREYHQEMMNTYQGKVVYLDIWSLNCAPCRAAMPYSKDLKELAGS